MLPASDEALARPTRFYAERGEIFQVHAEATALPKTSREDQLTQTKLEDTRPHF